MFSCIESKYGKVDMLFSWKWKREFILGELDSKFSSDYAGIRSNSLVLLLNIPLLMRAGTKTASALEFCSADKVSEY